jgi:ribonuclease HI
VSDKLTIYCDGGSRGNPGPAAIGIVVRNGHHKLVASISKKIGAATNNVAEYNAVIAALNWVLEHEKGADLEFYLDSELVVRQLKGEYKIKDSKLKELFYIVREKILQLDKEPSFIHIPRSKNSEADMLVNKALDE